MPFSKAYYHFVWATKHRAPMITDDNRDKIYSVIHANVSKMKGEVHAINGMEDHVHLVVTVPLKVSLSSFIGQIKGASSRQASAIQENEEDVFCWQKEYGVLTVSESHLPLVIRYVQNQQEHHTTNGLNQTLECDTP